MFMLGSDPELFIMDTVSGEYISAEDKKGPLIPGTKSNPYKVKSGAIQVDGVAAEFNIDPVDSFKGFYDNIFNVVGDLRTRIKKANQNFILKPTPTATFKKKYFDSLPKHTLELGCEPDFSAYTEGKPNPRPQTKEPFRTGSGHIHISWYSEGNFVDPKYEGHIMDCCLVAKQLDKYLLFASKDWDKDEKRRQLYGMPGSFRPKKYGMEYRPLSNAWLSSVDHIKTVYGITVAVMQGLDSAKLNLEINIKEEKGVKNSDVVTRALAQYYPHDAW